MKLMTYSWPSFWLMEKDWKDSGLVGDVVLQAVQWHLGNKLQEEKQCVPTVKLVISKYVHCK